MHKFNLNFTGLYNFEVYWTTLQTLLVNDYISFKIRSRINGIACFMLLVWIYHSKIFHFVFIILIIIIMTLWLVCSQEMERIKQSCFYWDSNLLSWIPLANRVQGSLMYCNLQNKFFSVLVHSPSVKGTDYKCKQKNKLKFGNLLSRAQLFEGRLGLIQG